MIRVFFALAALLLANPCHAQDVLPIRKPDQVGMSASKLEEIRDVVGNRIKENRVPGVVVMIARDDKVVFFEAYCDRDNPDRKPIEKDTIFRL